MTKEVYIAGVSMTAFSRHPDKSVKQLSAAAVDAALRDAGCDRKTIQSIYFGNALQGQMEGQHLIRGQVALLPLGFGGIPIFNVESGCATASAAFHLAINALRSGSIDVALAVAAEKMVSSDREKMFSAFDSGWDIETADETLAMFLAEGGEHEDGSPGQRSMFMDVYAAWARSHMRRYGVTQRQLAQIASKNHAHAVHNDRAHYRAPMSVDEVLAARALAYPLTVPMCAPISDGAAAAVLATAGGLKRMTGDRERPVRVRASVMRNATAREWDDLDNHLSRLAALEAYELAGVGPDEMDVAEVHDATAFGELIQTENLGFCARGAGGELAESDEAALGGRIPVNPSGGLECKGHPIGATGLGQIFELVTQLRGESGKRQVKDARLAIQENGGGVWGCEEATTHIAILERASTES